jgi:hypothetical protein
VGVHIAELVVNRHCVLLTGKRLWG